MLSIALLLVGMLLLLVGVLWVMSPGKAEPFLDAFGRPMTESLSEKIYADINGSRQGMFIKSRDITQPVLLYLHGGMPDYFLTGKHPTELESTFTVVWWEQRGAGISSGAAIPSQAVTMETLIADVVAVTDYLRQRFSKQKIYLLGHSGGTFLGIQTVARTPERYHAYIGVAQMSYQLQSECLAYDYMVREFKARGSKRAVRRLQGARVTLTGGIPPAYVRFRDQAMHRLGIGTMRNMRSLLTGLVLPSFQFREYTLTEKVNLWRAKAGSGISVLWNEMIATDLRRSVADLHTPIYFLHGRHDYTVNYALARSYFDAIKAPMKGFYTFDGSAHSPMFEEPRRFGQILREDVLAGQTDLADAKGHDPR
jgi:pimeloyl-ACP methyl ester carboxylesterase